MAIETDNEGYLNSGSYYADPENLEVPDQTHQSYAKGINSWLMAALPGLIGGGGDTSALEAELLNTKQAQGLLAIRQAIANNTAVNSNYYYAVDEYEDETGVDSTTMTYDGATDSYRTGSSSSHSMLIQSEESTAVVDGASDFRDSSTNKAVVTASGNAQTSIPAGGAVDGANDFYDSSTNGASVTANGNAQTSIPDGVTEFDPYGGTEPVLIGDGADDYLQAPSSTDFDFGTGDFFVSAWFKFDDVTAINAIVTKWLATTNKSWMIYVFNDEIDFYYTTNGSTNVGISTVGSGISDGTWHYVTARRDSGAFTIEVDGVERASADLTGVSFHVNSTPLKIGIYDTTSGDFNGSLSDVRIEKGSAGSATVPTSKPTVSTETFYLDHVADADPYGGAEPVFYHDAVSQSDRLDVADSADLEFGSDEFSIDFWIKPNNVGTNQYVFTKLNGNASQPASTLGWGFLQQTSGIVRFFCYPNNGGAGGSADLYATTVFSVGQWYHVSVTRSVDTLTLYIDGVSEDTTVLSAGAVINDTTVPVTLMNVTGVSRSVAGSMADPRIFIGSVVTPPVGGPTSKPTVSTEALYLDHDITNQTFTDAVDGGRVITANGNVTHSLAQSKFGNSSIYFDGTGDYLTVPDGGASGDFDFANGNFTIEAWVRPSTNNSTEAIIGRTVGATNFSWEIVLLSGVPRLRIASATSTYNNLDSTLGAVTAGVWQHISADFDGTTYRMYVDGVVAVSSVASYTIPDQSIDVGIGARPDGSLEFDGYIEEVSIVKGTARYAGAFTPPTAPYELTVTDPDMDSITFTAGTAPTKVAVVALMEPVDSVTINTDYNIFISPTADFANSQKVTLTYGGLEPASGGNIYVGEADISGLTAGTSVRYYLRGENGKDLMQHAIYLYYAD